jgi:hypothetical protein
VLNWAGTAFLAGILTCALAAPAAARVVARIGPSRKRMRVLVDGYPAYD